MRALLLLLSCSLLQSCVKEYEAPVPNTTWELFESNAAVPLGAPVRSRMTGVYDIVEGSAMFGTEAVLEWTWTREGADTAFHVSIFCERDMAYLTGAGKLLDSTILLNMYWRTLANTGTGLCRLTIAAEEGALVLGTGGALAPGDIRITGKFGSDGDVPDRPITLVYQRPVDTPDGFQVLAHRCGGRNADLLPAAENSVELIRMASRLGATGVEMDVRLTSDGIPVLYHDGTLNTRAIRPCGLFGPIESYSYAQLSGVVRLIHGERIPTLREALTTVVDQTPLTCVWLDIKFGGSLETIRALQEEYMIAAQAQGREVRILIGIPDEERLNAVLALPDHASVPSLCELDIPDVQAANSEVWAPRWTLGLQEAEVGQMHAEGRMAYVWTLDAPEYLVQFMQDGSFDGILSNYPSLVAFYNDARY